MGVFFETAFELWGESFSWAEVIGALTGVICVWWVAREVIWNFPMGLANNVFFFVLFVDAKLYADGVLQILFFVLGVYGWVVWVRGEGGGQRGDQEPVRRTSALEWRVLTATGALLWLVAYALARPAHRFAGADLGQPRAGAEPRRHLRPGARSCSSRGGSGSPSTSSRCRCSSASDLPLIALLYLVFGVHLRHRPARLAAVARDAVELGCRARRWSAMTRSHRARARHRQVLSTARRSPPCSSVLRRRPRVGV